MKHTLSLSKFDQSSASAQPVEAITVIGSERWQRLRKHLGTNAAIIACSLLLIAIVWSAVIAQIQLDRQGTIAQEIKENNNLVMAFEEHTVRTIKGVDAVALFLKHEYARLGPKIDIAQYIENGVIDNKLFTSASILNEHGDIVANSRPYRAVNLADREYFEVHARRNDNTLFIARPVVGRISNQWVFQMTRRINKPDGSFGGIVLVAINPTYFTEFYRQSDLGNNGLVMLVGLDGISRVRQAGQETSFGQDMTSSSLLREYKKNRNGSYLSAGKLDGAVRYVSYRGLPDYPLMVAVGTARDEVLTAFSQRQAQYYGAALLFSVVILFFTYLLIVTLNRQRHMVEALANSAAQFRATFEQAAVGIAHTGLDRRYLMVNQKFCDMLGYTREELLAMRSSQISTPDDQNLSPDNRRALVGEIGTYSAEKQYVRKDGSLLWVNRTVSLARSADGKPLYFIRVIQDITERKRAEEALTRERTLLRTVVDAIPERIYAKDRQGRFLLQNATNLKVRNITNHDEIIGKTVFDIFPRKLAERLHAEDEEVMATGVPLINREGQTTFGDPANGAVQWHLTSKVPLKDGAGNIVGLVGVNRDITERRASERQIEHLATHDALTNLPNRNLLHDRVAQAIGHARRTNLGLGMLFLDLDRFKYINDSFGHSVGDALIKVVAAELQGLVREGDTVARLGGDEFVVLLTDLKDAAVDAGTVASKLLDKFSRPITVEDREFTITMSAGVSLYPTDGQDMATLLMNADAAMYRAKDAGRNSFQFYTRDMRNQAIERVGIEADLRRALELGQFELHYQPQVRLDNGNTIGMEALVRWRHPERGLVSPAKFIPVAEETGLIVPIGEWVLRTACAQNKAWQDAGLSAIAVSVNLSALQLRQRDFVAQVSEILQETGLESRYLDLELTESMVMGNTASVIPRMHELQELGIALSMDDFGTGYSSLGALRSFPLSQFKIDQSFVRDLPGNRNAAAIALAIVKMGSSLGLRTIAEGVETPAQAEFLKNIQCEYAQGYLYSKPLPTAEFESWLIKVQSGKTSDNSTRQARQLSLVHSARG